MKPVILPLLVILAMLVAACASLQAANQSEGTQTSGMAPEVMPPVVVTAQSGGGAVQLPSATVAPIGNISSSGSALPEGGVTFSDNGKVFTMRVGESFLLNLGVDVYDWTVDLDNQDVIQRELNKTVIRGAQGIYIAQNPGTVMLTATGNPLCLQSRPPCMMPSILFGITVVVQ